MSGFDIAAIPLFSMASHVLNSDIYERTRGKSFSHVLHFTHTLRRALCAYYQTFLDAARGCLRPSRELNEAASQRLDAREAGAYTTRGTRGVVKSTSSRR